MIRAAKTRAIGMASAWVVAVALVGCTSSDQPVPRSSTPTPTQTATQSPGPSIAPTEPGDVRFGSKWDWSRVDSAAPWIKANAPGVTFYEFQWCDVSPTGAAPNWSAIDRVVKRSHELGVEMMLKIRTGTCEVTGGEAVSTRGNKNKSESRLPKDLDAYAAFVTSVVERYAPQDVHTYAIENEVNGETFWSGTGAQFEELFAVGSRAIRDADPKARVSDAGISSTAYGAAIASRLLAAGKEADAISAWNSYMDRRIGVRGKQIQHVDTRADLEDMLAQPQAVRNLEMLAANERVLKAGLADIRQVHFYEQPAAASLLADYLAATPPRGVDLEAWELGSFVKGRDPDEAERVRDVVQSTATFIGAGARVVIWLPLSTNPDGQNRDEPRSGLLDPDGTPRPAGDAFAAMRAASAGAEIVAVNTPQLRGVAFDVGGSVTAFVWAASGSVALPSGVSAASLATGSGASTVSVDPVKMTGGRADVQTIIPMMEQ